MCGSMAAPTPPALATLGLLLLLLTPAAWAEVFTSLADMEKMLGAEQTVAQRIRQYIQAERERLDELDR